MKTIIQYITEGNSLEATNLTKKTLNQKIVERVNKEKEVVAKAWLGEGGKLPAGAHDEDYIDHNTQCSNCGTAMVGGGTCKKCTDAIAKGKALRDSKPKAKPLEQ